jgi:hypothetical protein
MVEGKTEHKHTDRRSGINGQQADDESERAFRDIQIGQNTDVPGTSALPTPHLLPSDSPDG